MGHNHPQAPECARDLRLETSAVGAWQSTPRGRRQLCKGKRTDDGGGGKGGKGVKGGKRKTTEDRTPLHLDKLGDGIVPGTALGFIGRERLEREAIPERGEVVRELQPVVEVDLGAEMGSNLTGVEAFGSLFCTNTRVQENEELSLPPPPHALNCE